MTLNYKANKNLYVCGALFAIIAYFVFLTVPLLPNNLWNDEIYTLKKFTFVSLKKTLTDYHVPNNHIFYNLFDALYLRLVGITNLKMAFERPQMLRFPLLVVSSIIIFFSYRAGKLAGGWATGLLSALLLATAVPFQNFSLQIRGYTFSMLFDLLMVFYVLYYLRSPKIKYLLFMALATAAAMYSIPSNLYCVIGILFFLSVEIFTQITLKQTIDKKYIWPAVAVVLGVLLALLCYVPVLHQVFSNDYVKGETSDNKIITTQLLLLAINEFVSDKDFFFFSVWTVVLVYALSSIWNSTTPYALTLKLLLFQFITPALMVLIRGEEPPDRVFSYLIPMVVIFTAVILVVVITRMLILRLQFFVALFLPVYILTIHQLELHSLKVQMDANLKNEIRMQSLYYHYYLHNYHPLAVTRYLLKNSTSQNIPVIYKDSEPHDLPDYFSAFHLPCYPFDSLEQIIKEKKTAYIITRYPSQMDSAFIQEHHYTIHEVSAPSYHHILKLTPQ